MIMQKNHNKEHRRRFALHHLLTAMLAITVLAFLQGCGGGDSTGGGIGYSGDNSSGTATAASVPQVGTVNNLSSSGQPVRPGDWIEVNGSNFGTTQGTSYVGFTNGATTAQASLYDSWNDSKIVCRVPDGAPMTKRYAVREITQIFVSKSGTGNSSTFSTSSDPTPNPSPQPTPPGPTPTPSPTTPTPTPTPTPTTTPTPTPTQTGGGGGGSGGGVGPAAKLTFKVNPSNVVAGQAIAPSVEVKILDANGNLVTTATNEITISLNDIDKTGAVLSPPVTKALSGTMIKELSGDVTKAAVNGVAVFDDLSVDKTGEGYTLNAESGELTEAESGAFNVTPGAADHLYFNTPPVDGTMNVAMAPIMVYVVDTLGNLVTTDNTTMVSLEIRTGTDGAELTGGDAKQAAGGIVTFSNVEPFVTIDKSGVYTLAAKDAAEEPVIVEAVSNEFTLVAPGVDHPLFFQQPTDVVAGVNIAPPVTVRICNADDETVVDDNATKVTLSIFSGPEDANPQGLGPVTVVNGVATFNALTLEKAGDYILIATFTGMVGDPPQSVEFTVTHSVANQLKFDQNPPETVEEGAVIAPSVTVQILDQYGNLVNTGDGAVLPVTMTINSGSLGGDTTVEGIAGVATFGDLTVTPGNVGYVLTAGSGELEGANSSPFDVTAFITMVTSFSSAPGDENNPEKTAGGNENFIPNGDAGTKVQLISAAKFGETKGQVFFVGPTGTETEAVADDIIWTEALIECKVPANAEIGVGTVKVKPTAGGSYTKPFVTCPDGMTYVPEGTQGGGAINAFYMGECEVMNSEFRLFMNTVPGFTHENVWYKTPAIAIYESYPVESVNWNQAVQYCNWKTIQEFGSDTECCYTPTTYNQATYTYVPGKKGYRLGNNAGTINQSEWQYACQAGAGIAESWLYYWGLAFDTVDGPQGIDYCRYLDPDECRPINVGMLIPNNWGLYDMSGNAAELTDEIVEGISASTAYRGGAYWNATEDCQSSSESSTYVEMEWMGNGFRLVRTK